MCWFSRYNIFSTLLSMVVILDLVWRPIDLVPVTAQAAQNDHPSAGMDDFQSIPINDGDGDRCPDEFQGKCHCGYFGQDWINNQSSWIDPRSPQTVVGVQNGGRKFFTICVDSGFQTAQILKHVPNRTEVLIFRGNMFRILPSHLLDASKSYDQLTVVDLSNNSVQFVHETSFITMEHVSVLMLNDNHIRVIENGTMESIQDGQHPNPLHSFNKLNWLKPLAKLEELQLRNAFFQPDRNNIDRVLAELFDESTTNQLKVLNLERNHIGQGMDPMVFCRFPVLSRLLLAENDLEQFHFDLKCLHNLTQIDLSFNQMTTIDDETFNSIAMVGSLNYRWNISNNPFHCDCSLLDSYRWLDAISRQKNQLINNFNRSGIDQRPTILDWFEQLQCSTPANMSGKHLQHCDDCDQACEPTKHLYYQHILDSDPVFRRKQLEAQQKQELETRNFLHHIMEIVLMNTLGVILFFATMGMVLLMKSQFCRTLADTVQCKKQSDDVTYEPLDPALLPEVRYHHGEPPEITANGPQDGGAQPQSAAPAPAPADVAAPPPSSTDQIQMDSFSA